MDLVAQIDHATDHTDAIRRLAPGLAKIPNVLTSPAPEIEVLEFNLAGTVLAVRPYCHNDHYWQVHFAANRLILETFGAAGYAVPQQHHVVHTGTERSG